jgi:hypothetical protein
VLPVFFIFYLDKTSQYFFRPPLAAKFFLHNPIILFFKNRRFN